MKILKVGFYRSILLYFSLSMLFVHKIHPDFLSTPRKPKLVILLGPPKSGEGFVLAKISNLLSMRLIFSGWLVRQHLHEDTIIGQKIRSCLDDAKPLPDDLLLKLFYATLKNNSYSLSYVMSCLPKTVEQAKDIQNALSDMYDIVVFVIDAQDESFIERNSKRFICSSCGIVYHTELCPPKKHNECDVCNEELWQRTEDFPENIQKQIDTWKSTTEPLLHYYEKIGVLTKIDGTCSVDEMAHQIKNLLSNNSS